MSALATSQPWLNLPIGAAVMRVPLRIARCPGCELDPAHPCARSCDRLGCPMKHMGGAAHAGSNIVSEARHHG